MDELALFAGGAGGLLGSQIIGLNTVCAVENDPDCIDTLLRRQKDGVLPVFPIWDDVRTFDGSTWAGKIDVITGGFPCTDISCAGKGGGITGESSRLFFEMLRIIEEVRPRFVFAENSPNLRTKGLGAVLEGFTRLGYMGCYGVLGAGDVGANHIRKRMWIVATNANNRRKRAISINAEMAGASAYAGLAAKTTNASGIGGESWHVSSIPKETEPHAEGAPCRSDEIGCPSDPNRESVRHQQGRRNVEAGQGAAIAGITNWWSIPRFARMDDGGANRVDVEKAFAKMEMDGVAEKPRDRNARVRMTGNMQVPLVAATMWRVLTEVIGEQK